MDIEHVKRWHWAVIGLIAGLLFAATRLFYGHDYAGQSLDQNFNTVVFGSPQQPILVGFFFGPKRWCYVTDVTIHPPTAPDPRVEGPKATGVQWVTGTLHEATFGQKRSASGQLMFEDSHVSPFFHRSALPYKANDKTYPDVRAYLDDVAHQTSGKSAPYRVAWWERPALAWSVYPAAGLLLIGGVWPTLLSLMVGAGLGRKRPGTPGVDLSKYKSTATAPTPGSKADLTDADRQQLDAVAAAMEADLAAGATDRAARDAATADATPPVRELETAPLTGPATDEHGKPKTFGAGDYYPTEIHRPADEGDDQHRR